MTETRGLSFGIFWVITDSEDLENYKLLCFNVHCDAYGNPIESPVIQLNSKSGTSYNHKAIWDSHVKNNFVHKPYNKKGYNYYPRGRVEIANNRAVIYLNPLINKAQIIEDIRAEFGLTIKNVARIKVAPDNSAHYACFID